MFFLSIYIKNELKTFLTFFFLLLYEKKIIYLSFKKKKKQFKIYKNNIRNYVTNLFSKLVISR